MNYTLSDDEQKWIDEEIDKSARATPEQRIAWLDSMRHLYAAGARQRGELNLDHRELEKRVDANYSGLKKSQQDSPKYEP